MSEYRQFLRNSTIMAAMTTLSRVFGLVRDQVTAYLLGATRLGDIWTIAFMLPNLFRRLIAEGAMSTAFVPILSELENDKDLAREFTAAMFSLVLTASGILVTAFIIAMPWILPGLLGILNPTGQETGDLNAMILPTQLLFPYLLFISLAAICQGVLNLKNRFALAASTPIFLNAAIILFGLALKDWRGNPLWGMCIGVLIGGFLQFFLQWLGLSRMGLRIVPTLSFWNPRTKEAIKLWLPSTFSAGVVQINAFTSGMIAISLVEGAAITLGYSTRLTELVLGIFTASITTSILPLLSRQRSRNDLAAQNQVLWESMEMMTLICMPAAIGLMVAGPSLIGLLFMRGAFDQRGLELTSSALLFHSMGLIPISWYRILNQAYYAHKQVKITVLFATISAAANIIFCYTFPSLFASEFSHCGIALATLASSWLLFACAWIYLERKLSFHWPRKLSFDLGKIALAALAFVPLWFPLGVRLTHPGDLLLKILASILIYVTLLVAFRVSSLSKLIQKFRGRLPIPGPRSG